MKSFSLSAVVIVAWLAWAASFAPAANPNGAADYRPLIETEESTPSLSQATFDQSENAGYREVDSHPSAFRSRWTATADFIVLQRCGGSSQTLVERVPGVPTRDRVPGSTTFGNLFTAPGVEVLSGDDFQPGFRVGPKIGLLRHGDSGYDLELSYFQIDGWHSDRTVVPNDPDECLLMRTPGEWISPAATPGGWSGWIQTNQDATQAFAWQYATQLHDAQFNVQWNPYHRVTMLAGFRWMNLHENLTAELSPATISTEPPFWNTTTSNNLLGFQIGAKGQIWQRGRFSIDGLVKAGIFDNNAEQATAVSVIAKQVRSDSAATNHAAFVGETGLWCKYRVTDRLTLRAGYEILWLEGVALAPGQIQESYTTTRVFENAVQVLGVNCDSGVFYHGATFGTEYSF